MMATKKELFYDHVAEVWDSQINNSETNKRVEVVFEELMKNIPIRGKLFLEVGCGMGYFSEVASKKGAKVTGIDIGKRLVKICKGKIPKGKFLVASASKLPFKNNTFDITLCTEVIEHVEKPLDSLEQLVRVTKKGGHIVVTTPNKIFKPLFDLLGVLKIRFYQGNENWFFPWELERIFSNQSVKIIRRRYFNFLFPNRFLDKAEDLPFAKFITINQGYLLKKL